MHARNEQGQVGCYVLETEGAKGLTRTKIENKYSYRMMQNADVTFKDCFVPEGNKLDKANDFASGTNRILYQSRLGIAWMIAGLCSGAYEAALKYALDRKQFGKPIASFQLTQEKLSRALAYCEMIVSHLIQVSYWMMDGTCTIG